MRVLASFLAALAVSSLALAGSNPDNFVQWRKGLASSAQPDANWLASARQNGYDVVVNLAPPEVHGSLREEGGLVAATGATGATYVNIPVHFKHPTAEDFRFFGEVLRANAGRNVLVHCQVNLRGSSFTFLYRVLGEGADVAEARAKLESVWNPDPVWREFIETTLKAHGKSADLF